MAKQPKPVSAREIRKMQNAEDAAASARRHGDLDEARKQAATAGGIAGRIRAYQHSREV